MFSTPLSGYQLASTKALRDMSQPQLPLYNKIMIVTAATPAALRVDGCRACESVPGISCLK